jgi:hypothetical protein
MTRTLSAVAVTMLCSVAAVGCGRDALVNVPSTVPAVPQVDVPRPPATTGGSGGTAGRGGMGGTGGGTGGRGGAGVPDAQPQRPRLDAMPVPVPDAAPVAACPALPRCLQALTARCDTSGAQCLSRRTMGNTNQCYSNGVRISATTGPPPAARTTAADGTLCYTAAANITAVGGMIGATVTYSDPAGNVVASGIFQGGPGSGVINIFCGGNQNGVPTPLPVVCAPGVSVVLATGTGTTAACPAATGTACP